MNEQEKNYCGTRLEMLALVNYMDHFCYYLVGQKYRLRTDNHSLVWLMSFKEPQGQVARWLGRLQYDSQIQRHPGRLHNSADALTRRPRRQHGNCPSCTQTGLSQVTLRCRKGGGNQMLRNFTSMRYAARDVWAQFELLLLKTA